MYLCFKQISRLVNSVTIFLEIYNLTAWKFRYMDFVQINPNINCVEEQKFDISETTTNYPKSFYSRLCFL